MRKLLGAGAAVASLGLVLGGGLAASVLAGPAAGNSGVRPSHAVLADVYLHNPRGSNDRLQSVSADGVEEDGV